MPEIIPVSALNTYVRSLLEADPVLKDIAIQGEIGNFVRNSRSGHCYFSLTDAKASVKAVMFRSNAQNMRIDPQNGMRVLARGRVSLYERDGAFQLYVEDLFPDGVGEAHLAFELLKEKLAQEGLFAPEHKKPLPTFPRCVGVISSATGAALQDIIKVSQKRCPVVQFLLAPVHVQGQQTEPEVVAAVQLLDARPEVECILIARGGGSAEDLSAFNSEAIARAVFEAKTPVVSAIGHEIDFTILDFVADLRAPTPSAAAEMVLPDLQAEVKSMEYLCANIAGRVQNRWDSCYNKWVGCGQHPALQASRRLWQLGSQEMNEKGSHLRQKMQQHLEAAGQQLARLAGLATERNPYTQLERGYAVVQKDKKAVKSVRDLQAGEDVNIILRDGTLEALVKNVLV